MSEAKPLKRALEGTPETALAIGAHPDDIEFGAGATLAKWVAEGCVVHVVVLTDGSKGTWNPDAAIAELVTRRQGEAAAALRALGSLGEVVFVGEIDGELEARRELVDRLALEIRRLRPQVVLGHDPWKRYRLHPDHRHAGNLTVEAVVGARDPHFFKHHPYPRFRPSELWLFEADEVNHVEPVSSGDCARRVDALLAHQSQFETTHFHRLDDPTTAAEGFARRERELLAATGAAWGYELGEAFHVMADL